MLLETTSKIRVNTEEDAQIMIEKFRSEAAQKHYIIKKASYERKEKKAKGEVIAEVFVVSITQVFNELWEDII